MHSVICVINCWCTGISKNCFSPQNSRHVEDFKKLPDRLMQKSPCSNFSTRKKFCVSVIYLELDTKIMSLFSDCRRFVHWESHQLAATTMSQLSHHCPFLTCSEFCESYSQHQWRGICWVKTRPESWYHSIRGRSILWGSFWTTEYSNLPKNIIAN